MKLKNMREKSIVLNKVDGKQYEIISVTTDAALACDVDLLDVELAPVISINAENDICFRLVKDSPLPLPTPEGYTAVGGELLHKGVAVTEMGDIKITAVLGYIEGAVVVWDEGSHKAYLYNPHTDRFTYLNDFTKPKFAAIGKYGVISSVVTEEKTVDGQPEEKYTVVNEGLTILFSRKGIVDEYGYSFMDINPEDVVIVENNTIIGGTLYTVKVGTNGERKVDTAEYAYQAFIVQPFSEWSMGYVVTGVKAIVKPSIYGPTLRTPDKIFVPCREQEFSLGKVNLEVDMFLVDITEKGDTTTLTFADKSYNCKKVVIRQTSDRGLVVTTE